MPLKKKLAQLFQRQPPTPPNSPVHPQNQPLHDLVLPTEQPFPPPNVQQQDNLDFPILVVVFCLTGAIEIAIPSLENQPVHPVTFHSLRLMIVLTIASIFVAKYIASKKHNAARLLESVWSILWGHSILPRCYHVFSSLPYDHLVGHLCPFVASYSPLQLPSNSSQYLTRISRTEDCDSFYSGRHNQSRLVVIIF